MVAPDRTHRMAAPKQWTGTADSPLCLRCWWAGPRMPGYNPAMSLIVEYIAGLAPWIYALCGLSALVYLYRVRSIRTERLQAIFALERERAARATAGIVTSVIGLLVVMGLTYFISNVDQAMEDETGAEAPVEARTESGSASGLGAEPGLNPVDETTGAGQVATPPEDLRNVPICDDESASLSSPAVAEQLSGRVAVQGTAAHDDLASYAIDIAPGSDPADQDFTLLGTAYNTVRTGLLWEFDASAIGLSGPYTLRLSVLDADDAPLATCSVAVRIVN